MNTVDFIDAVRKKHGLTSDWQVKKLLGWRPARVYEYRRGARELDDQGCIDIARALDIPPAYVMACIAAERAKSAEAKREWLRAAKLLKKGLAASVAVAVFAMLQTPAPARAESSVFQNDFLYIMRTRRRRRRSRAFYTARLRSRFQRRHVVRTTKNFRGLR